MTKRTRHFLFIATGILVVGLGTGLVASYMGGLQGLPLLGGGLVELEYVPADARMLGFASVRDVMDSELRQKLMQHLQPGGGDGADKFQEETGVNLQTDVDAIVASMSGDSGAGDERTLLLARGRFDVAKLEALAVAKGAVVQEYNRRRLLTHVEGNMSLAFLEDGLIGIGTPDALHRAIDTKDTGANVTENAEIMRLVKDIDDGNAWAVARFDALTGGPNLPADLAKQLPAINWFAASGHVNGGIRGVVQAEARDEAAAKDLRDVIRGFVALARIQTSQQAEFADLMNSLQLGGEGRKVSLGFAIPPDMIDAIGAMHARRPAPELNRRPRPELPTLPSTPAL